MINKKKCAVHVFVGAGPANLHRALKIRKIDPTAKLVFIDQRLKPALKDFDRKRARANIFRFETDEVVPKLLEDGVDINDLRPFIEEREFSVSQGFQYGDDTVFSAKPFTQIQIRDLQSVFLKTLHKLGAEPLLIPAEVNAESDQLIHDKVVRLLDVYKKSKQLAGIKLDEMQIHVATGALRGNEEKDELIHPEKATYLMATASPDVKAMSVTPLHGTTTFMLSNSSITCEMLKRDQRSLDSLAWEPALKRFGWNLIRPPRVRVFYAGDILYVGAEIPVSLYKLEGAKYEEELKKYNQTIASLVFPHLPIASLPVNPFSSSKFEAPRGELGVSIRLLEAKNVRPESKESPIGATLFYHGDTHYLPHYQTGSGFVTGFLVNQVYAEVYSCSSFVELARLAKGRKSVEEKKSEEKLPNLETEYLRKSRGNRHVALQMCKAEVLTSLTRDILEKNKEKVGNYFNALNRQELEILGKQLAWLIEVYNKHHSVKVSLAQFKQIDSRLVAIKLLATENIAFIREITPRLLNVDIAGWKQSVLLEKYSLHLGDYVNNASKVENKAENKGSFLFNIQEIMKETPENFFREITRITQHFQSDEAKMLHKRKAFFSFGKAGVHSDTICNFLKEAKVLLGNTNKDKELRKIELFVLVMKFHNDLMKGQSVRTVFSLTTIVNQIAQLPSMPRP